MNLVASGEPWKFEQPVSKQQAETAIPYLVSLGFQVRRVSGYSSIKLASPRNIPSSPGEVTEEDLEAEEEKPSRWRDSLEFSFKGDALDLTALYLKLWVFSLLSLGVYSFWGRTELRQYIWSQSSLGGESFRYRGTAQGLATTGVKTLLATVFAFFFLLWLHRVDPLLSPFFETLFFVAGLFGLFYLAWSETRYRLSKTQWHNLTFSFRGRFRSWFGLHLKGWLLLVLSLGLYGPVYWSQAWKFRIEHTAFGGQAFRYSGSWRDIARPFYIGWGVTLVTFGWGAPLWFWSFIVIKQALWRRTHFDQGTFEFNLDLKAWARLQIENVLILIFSLGLGYPCMKKRGLDFNLRHLALVDIPRWQELLVLLKKNEGRKNQPTFKNSKNV